MKWLVIITLLCTKVFAQDPFDPFFNVKSAAAVVDSVPNIAFMRTNSVSFGWRTNTYTAPGGDNTCLIVLASIRSLEALNPAPTWNGTAMVLMESNIVDDPHAYVYVLVNPTSGAHDLGSGNLFVQPATIGVLFLTNVNQTTPIANISETAGTGGPQAVSATTSSSTLNIVMDFMASYRGGASLPTVGAGQTILIQGTANGDGTGDGAACSISKKPGAASVGTSWNTVDGFDLWVYYAFEVKAP